MQCKVLPSASDIHLLLRFVNSAVTSTLTEDESGVDEAHTCTSGPPRNANGGGVSSDTLTTEKGGHTTGYQLNKVVSQIKKSNNYYISCMQYFIKQ